MKINIFSHRKTLLILSAILCLVVLSQCNGCKNKAKESPYAKVAVNPAFATNPPIATNVSITEISPATDSGNLLLEATIPKEKINSDVLALILGDSTKVVLHDDGKNGDKVAGDGVYSTVMNVNIDSLRLYIGDRATEATRLLSENKQLFQFDGRMEFPLSTTALASLTSLANIKTDQINLKEKFAFINPSIIHLLFPVTEAFKHTALTVTDPSVVNDSSRTFNPCINKGTAGGAWTFGKLITDMAATSGITPENFMLNWLNTWNSDQTVNSDVITKRTNINTIINNWHTLCGGPAAPLNVNKAPFKLLAIVNRFDLRSGGAYGGGNAGEGRFVFCATDANCNPQSFFVIFEYGVNKTTCASIHAYAQEWINLASLPFPSPAYNIALQHITDQFAKAGTNPSKPNGSSLDQLRTNEFALGILPWELREFHINPTTHSLFNVTVKREPQIPFNGRGGVNTAAVDSFGEFVNANMRDVINDKMELPDNLSVSGTPTPFIAGKAHTLDPSSFHWDALETSGTGHIINDTARFHISLNTCSGCHGGEANTGTFTQVGLPVSPGGPAHLSSFLTGNPAFSNSPFLVSDRANRPAGSPIQWPFNDLERRGRDLMDFSSTLCFPIFHVPVLINQHVPVWAPVELTRQLLFSPVTMSD